jgi:CO dehydrogenase/acetyl-CoA synthase beta subunit
MALFDRSLAEIRAFLASARARRHSPLPSSEVESWTAGPGPQVVLAEEVGLELGSASGASLSLILWQTTPGLDDGRITLVGPDLSEASGRQLAFAQLVLVQLASDPGDDAYERYRQLRDAVFQLRLRGLMYRVLPSRQSIWCRVSRETLAGGLDARVLGSALLSRVQALHFVEAAQVVLVTSPEGVAELARAGSLALDTVEALVRMQDQAAMDCESCEHQQTCDVVDELRELHARLVAGRKGP